MTTHVKPIPADYHTITPALSVRGGIEALEFYKRAFGAKERMRFPGPDGKSLMHAELKIGDSILMLGDEQPDMGCRGPQSLGGTTVSLYLYVEDVDKSFSQAVSAGAKPLMPVADMFWGDRMGKVADPFGHEWTLSTHKEDVTPEEARKRGEAFFREMAKPAAASSASR
ncbi:MAG: VOC family protein [Nitrospiraceae bacterium]